MCGGIGAMRSRRGEYAGTWIVPPAEVALVGADAVVFYPYPVPYLAE